MNFAHFYHLYADGEWREPVDEHLSALAKVGFSAPLHLGVVGAPERRQEAIDHVSRYRAVASVVEADRGFEQVTLRRVRDHARRHRDGVTLYAHTKGASRPSRLQDAWRRSMTCALLAGVHGPATDALDSHLASLAIAYDVVGCHWLTADQYGHISVQTRYPMIGGNFWLARNDYLASLPPLGRERHDAEAWLGEGPRPPRVLDLNPGWPGTTPWVTKIGWPK